LEYTVEANKNWHTVVNVSIPAAEVQPQLDERFREYQDRVKLEGFRKGKVPPQLVKKMFGKKIESEVFQPFISDALKKVFADDQFDLLNTPEVVNIDFDATLGLRFAFAFDVRPVFQVGNFNGLEIEKDVFTISEEDVAAAMEDLRQRNAMIYSVEGEAQKGHLLVADLQELDRGGLPIVGAKYDNQTLQLSDANEELTSQLLGINAGGERRISITMQPEKSEFIGTPDQENAQQRFFLIKAKEVKERRVPELDDEFAKDVGNYSTLQELKEDIEKRLKAQAESDSDFLFKRALADEIIKRSDLEAPQYMVDRYMDILVRDARANSKQKIDELQIRDQYKSYAIREIKWHLISSQIARQEGIEVADDEVESALAGLEQAGKSGASRAKAIRGKEKEIESFKERLLEDKVYAFLSQRAKVKETKKNYRTSPEEK
jgi:trigger factor